jgi:BlaI family penicillinase repressor
LKGLGRLRLSKPKAIPTAGEFRLLEILWRLGEGTIEDFLQAAEKNNPLNYKTVQTVLRIMENKKFVSHSVRGRAFVYRPRVKRSQVSRSSLALFARQIFSRFSLRTAGQLAGDRAY